jgi:hypothetical protein
VNDIAVFGEFSGHWVGFLALFALACIFVVIEEVLQLCKSKPMLLAAALISDGVEFQRPSLRRSSC